jgi:predicted nucleic acid-binding Zn ribbon protein
MNKYRYWGMISLLGAGLALTLAGCGGGGGGGGSTAVGNDTSYTSSAVVTTLAGSGSSGFADNTTGTSATFNAPTGLALNLANSYLYLADSGNNSIRTIKLLTPFIVGTFYNSTLSGPEGLVFNGDVLYVCDTKNSVVRTISSDHSSVSAFVSSGLNYPTGIILSGSYFYVADSKNNVIKQISSSGSIITTYGNATAGNTGSTYGVNTPATSAEFNNPYGVASDGTYLYVTDCANSTIRKINISSSTVTILAGLPGTTGTNDSDSIEGTGESATFNKPTGITYYNGYLYVADTGNHAIRKVNVSNGYVETIAGYKGYANFANGTGNTTKFSSPTGIVSDGAGTLYVADKGNNRIRKIEL